MEMKDKECKYCNKCFKKLQHLEVHLRIHEGIKPYGCPICLKNFTQQSGLLQHLRKHTGERPYACDKCDKRFIQQSHLQQHDRCHTGEKPYKCKECDQSFVQLCHLKSHEKCHTGDTQNRPYKCNECDQCFVHLCHLKKHARIHIAEGTPFKLDLSTSTGDANDGVDSGESDEIVPKVRSKMKIDNQNLDVRKKRLHIEDKPHKCSQCDQSFQRRYQLQKHERTHESEELYRDDDTDDAMLNSLKSGLYVKSESSRKVCSKCLGGFLYSTDYEKHIQNCKHHVCAKCHGCFLSSTDYEEHIRNCKQLNVETENMARVITKNDASELPADSNIEQNDSKVDEHEGNKSKRECSYCNKVFGSSSHLLIHLRIHEGIRPYSCSICPKKFTQKGGLQRHLRTHTDEGPYVCNQCDKSFIRLSHFQKHNRLHTGENPFKCGQCDQSFVQLSCLRQHVKVHSGKTKPYECSHCVSGYNQLCQLKDHLAKIHGIFTKKVQKKEKKNKKGSVPKKLKLEFGRARRESRKKKSERKKNRNGSVDDVDDHCSDVDLGSTVGISKELDLQSENSSSTIEDYPNLEESRSNISCNDKHVDVGERNRVWTDVECVDISDESELEMECTIEDEELYENNEYISDEDKKKFDDTNHMIDHDDVSYTQLFENGCSSYSVDIVSGQPVRCRIENDINLKENPDLSEGTIDIKVENDSIMKPFGCGGCFKAFCSKEKAIECFKNHADG